MPDGANEYAQEPVLLRLPLGRHHEPVLKETERSQGEAV